MPFDHDDINAWCCLLGSLISIGFTGRTLLLYKELQKWSTGAIQPKHLASELLPSIHTRSAGLTSSPSAPRLVAVTSHVHNLSLISSHVLLPSTNVSERFLGGEPAPQDEYHAVDAFTVLSDPTSVANRRDRSVRGARVATEASGRHTALQSTSSHGAYSSSRHTPEPIRGLQAVLPVESVKRLHNPINTVFVCVVMIRAMQSLIQGAGAVVTLAGAPYPSAETHCPASNHILAPFNETALPALVCDSSAMLVQFTDAAATTMLALVLLAIAARNGARCCFRWPRALHTAMLLASQSVAAGTAVGMWVFLPTLPSGSRFTASAAWCWIPTENGTVSHLELLRFACAYWFAPVVLLITLAACININRLITRDAAWHFQRRCQVRETRHQRLALARRFVPLVVYYVLYVAVSGLSRTSMAYAESPVVHAVASFLYPVDAAVSSLMWAYAEGLTRVLIMGDRAGVKPSSAMDVDGMQLPHVPFSLLVAEMYNLDFRSEDERRRELAGRSDADWFLQSARACADDASPLSPTVTPSTAPSGLRGINASTVTEIPTQTTDGYTMGRDWY